MIEEITLIVRPEDEHDELVLKHKAAEALSKKNINARNKDIRLAVVKRSIDARHGRIRICLRCKAYIGEAPDVQFEKSVPEWKRADGARRVVIVGSGPAGLFGALRLLEDGITPIIVERGEETDERKKTIAKIGTKGSVDGDSNYCFGEGGAGAFSDGKLYTRSTKRGDVGRILALFNFFGASESILSDAHPHIGTDKLPKIVNAMREKIMSLGGEFHSCTKCVDFLTETENGKKRITGIAAEHTKTKEKRTIEADAVLLASGHSANDIYALVARCAPEALEAKLMQALRAGNRAAAEASYGDTVRELCEYRYAAIVFNLKRLYVNLTAALDGTPSAEKEERLYDSADRIALVIEQAKDISDIDAEYYALMEKICAQSEEQHKQKQKKTAERIKRIVDEQLYDAQLSSKAIADSLGLSDTYVSKLFKASENISIANYINEARMAHAKRLLLETDLTIKEIAERIGISNSQYFYVLFRKYFSVSPAQFRRRPEQRTEKAYGDD